MAQRKIHVVVNPAAGQDIPVLSILNNVFQKASVEWDVSITQKTGDAQHQAREAAEKGADVVAAYGGDGTIAEVASGLIGTNAALAVLPGGTANVMSIELGIPADRALKDKFGVLAYLWSAVQNLAQSEVAHYRLTIDDSEVECEGLTCIIANSTNLGQAGVNLAPNSSVNDGLLDVIVIQQANLGTLFDVLGSITGLKQVPLEQNAKDVSDLSFQIQQNLQHWQGQEVTLVANPAQTVQFDGEVLGKVPIRCVSVPNAVRVLTSTMAEPSSDSSQRVKGEQAL